MRAKQLGALGGAALVLAILGARFLGQGGAVATDDALDLTEAGQATAKLKRVDTSQPEVSCQAKGSGAQSGDAQGVFDGAANTLAFQFTVSGTVPNADYLLDVTECTTQGQRIARGDAGHLHIDGAGNATFKGTWEPQSDATTVKLTLIRFCLGPKDAVPTIPCDDQGFATDALLPPGLEKAKRARGRH